MGFDSSSDATINNHSGGVCNNGTLDPGERCDTVVNADYTCMSLGFLTGILTCDDCQFNTSQCTRLESCGNGALDTAEQCEAFELRDANASELRLDLQTVANSLEFAYIPKTRWANRIHQRKRALYEK